MKYSVEFRDGKWTIVTVPHDQGKFATYRDAAAEAKRLNQQPAQPTIPASEPMDFDSGFGIGGISSAESLDQQAYEETKMLIAAMDKPARPQTSRKMPHGQLWEECPRCGTEPVCVDCGYCERHCTC